MVTKIVHLRCMLCARMHYTASLLSALGGPFIVGGTIYFCCAWSGGTDFRGTIYSVTIGIYREIETIS